MWVKICGNTRLDDCLRAADLGADALGFIFAHGKRLVTAEHVRAITRDLPPSVATFGVFTQSDPAYILRTAETAGLTGVQLHGSFDPELARPLRQHFPQHATQRGQPRIVQVVPWWVDSAADSQGATLRRAIESIAETGLIDAVLIDSRTRQASGGTGIAFDWKAAAAAFRNLPLPLIVAGGLHPGNVAEAIATLAPWGVDVSSGVETSPGIKDHARLQELLRASRIGQGI